MKSIDTNILLYAINSDCGEHESAKNLIHRALKEPRDWIIADQVWFELYRLLRNPMVLKKPLSAKQASDLISWYRNKTGWLSCSWEPDMMPKLSSLWSESNFSGRTTFDAVLAVSLKTFGVNKLYTRNVKDFLEFGFFDVEDPIL